MISHIIWELTEYALAKGLIGPEDRVWTINRLLELFQEDGYDEPAAAAAGSVRSIAEILEEALDFAIRKGLCEDSQEARDLFDTKICGILTPAPSEVIRKFEGLRQLSPMAATGWYYSFSCATNYIRLDRIEKDEKWVTDTEYGKLDITINLSKPEKDPRDIARAGRAAKSGYPACLLCRENEGYAGHFGHPARQNHRLIPITLCGERYYLQYSPYVYYNEHCIILNEEHLPMKIDRDAFAKLLDFVTQFPHYTAGSNADLPIVGGSILSHDHFQGGNYEFPMARAPYEWEFSLDSHSNGEGGEGSEGRERGEGSHSSIRAGVIRWPMSVIRLQCEPKDLEELIDAADEILAAWRAYSDPDAFVFAETEGEPHNTITPIARRRGELYELDLVLRNNITTEEHPLGVFHPHAEYHHIKKENIGLIEVMGLAVLPARLKKEMAALEAAILEGTDLRASELTASHADWAESWLPDLAAGEDLHARIQEEIGKVFAGVLGDAGVFKNKEAFGRFVQSL